MPYPLVRGLSLHISDHFNLWKVKIATVEMLRSNGALFKTVLIATVEELPLGVVFRTILQLTVKQCSCGLIIGKVVGIKFL